jgi:hypothetical protein
MLGRVMLCAAFVAACSANEPSDQQANFDLMRYAFAPTRLPYGSYAAGLADRCCPQTDPIWSLPRETPAVCRELQRTIEQEKPDASTFFWGPHCHDVIPASTLMGAVARGEHDFAWQGALTVLSERDPTPGTQQLLFDELSKLEMPSDDPAVSGVDDWSRVPPRMLTVALAVGGEDELRITATRLRSRDPHQRLWAAHVFFYAASLPLDLPEVLPVLEQLAANDSPRIAERASYAAAALRSWESFDIDSWAGLAASVDLQSENGRYPPVHLATRILQAQDRHGKLLAIQMFGRRRAFCRSRVATAVLETLRKDGDARIADLARRASDLRKRRCVAP